MRRQSRGSVPRPAHSLAQVIERPAFDELHRQKVDAVDLLDGVDRDDGRMIDRRDRTGLAPEAIQHLVTRGQFGGQHLDRDIAIEARVVGAVHLAHSPCPIVSRIR